MRPSDLLLDFGRPVAYYPGLVKLMGSPHAVIFFSQIFYWQDKAHAVEGAHKTREAIQEETGLTFDQQATARKQLVSRGILIETHKRLQHKVYFRIDCERLDEIISENNELLRKGESRFREEGKPNFGKAEKPSSPTLESPRRQSGESGFDHTEITSETTSEITSDGTSAKAAEPSRNAKQDYSPEFEEAWQAYPKRSGGNPKPSAWKAWSARIREGVKTADMLAGVQRYASYVTATGKANSEYVKQASTFFGPDHHFAESWTAPASQQRSTPAQSRHSGFSERDYGTTTKPSWAKGAAE
ncbi:DNA-binding protein [Pantoea sp. PGP6]